MIISIESYIYLKITLDSINLLQTSVGSKILSFWRTLHPSRSSSLYEKADIPKVLPATYRLRYSSPRIRTARKVPTTAATDTNLQRQTSSIVRQEAGVVRYHGQQYLPT